MWLINEEKKRRSDAAEDEGQVNNIDNVYQPAAANVAGRASGSRKDKRET